MDEFFYGPLNFFDSKTMFVDVLGKKTYVVVLPEL